MQLPSADVQSFQRWLCLPFGDILPTSL